jgi:hypothetical protein
MSAASAAGEAIHLRAGFIDRKAYAYTAAAKKCGLALLFSA